MHRSPRVRCPDLHLLGTPEVPRLEPRLEDDGVVVWPGRHVPLGHVLVPCRSANVLLMPQPKREGGVFGHAAVGRSIGDDRYGVLVDTAGGGGRRPWGSGTSGGNSVAISTSIARSLPRDRQQHHPCQAQMYCHHHHRRRRHSNTLNQSTRERTSNISASSSSSVSRVSRLMSHAHVSPDGQSSAAW